MPKMNRGKFIVFEGLDGSGITTQAQLLFHHLEKYFPVLSTREPTQGPMGLLLRLMLSHRLNLNAKTASLEDMASSATALLFAADRLDHLQQVIIPKLEEGVTVICERYYLSSFAYQMGKESKNLEWLQSINSKCLTPDLIIFLNTPLEVCEKRRSKRWSQELYEKSEILRQVSANYQHVITQLQNSIPIEILDGSPLESVVFSQILNSLHKRFPNFFDASI